MRRNLVTVPVLALLAAWSLGAAAQTPSDTSAPAAPAGAVGEKLGVEMTIQKAGAEYGTYVCRTTVTDLRTHTVLDQPSVKFRMGENAKTTTQGDGYSVEVSVFVSNGGEQVDHVVVLKRDGVITASQAMTVHLPM
jgi:hypothetical protein